MIQEILVILIIVAAVGYTIYSVVKSVTSKDVACLDDCMGGCDIKRQIAKNQLKMKVDKR